MAEEQHLLLSPTGGNWVQHVEGSKPSGADSDKLSVHRKRFGMRQGEGNGFVDLFGFDEDFDAGMKLEICTGTSLGSLSAGQYVLPRINRLRTMSTTATKANSLRKNNDCVKCVPERTFVSCTLAKIFAMTAVTGSLSATETNMSTC